METPVVKVVVMEAGDVHEGVPGECMRSESTPGDDVRPHHMTAVAVTGKSVAGKAGVPAETTVPASATMTTTAAVTAPAAVRDGEEVDQLRSRLRVVLDDQYAAARFGQCRVLRSSRQK